MKNGEMKPDSLDCYNYSCRQQTKISSIYPVENGQEGTRTAGDKVDLIRGGSPGIPRVKSVGKAQRNSGRRVLPIAPLPVGPLTQYIGGQVFAFTQYAIGRCFC